TDFRLNSSSRYFSDTSFLNSNENFAMRPQFLIWCLTFGAHYNIDGRDCCQTGQFSQDVVDGALTQLVENVFSYVCSDDLFI
ncbi:hypothetical protein ACPUEX_22780, partial [Enterobacter vonholyi]